MRRRIFLLHSLLLLCFMVTVVPSYGYNEYFTVDVTRPVCRPLVIYLPASLRGIRFTAFLL